jgi:hypothetical protein
MEPLPLSVQWMIFGIVLANLLALAGYVAYVKIKARRQQKNIFKINAAIIDHFQRNGVGVRVSCTNLHGDKRFTAFIESEPMKQFRLSHIIEMVLRQHVAKTCGLTLDKIYWRFPIKEAQPTTVSRNMNPATESGADAAVPTTDAKPPHDDYINEGLINYKDLPKADVSEIPWEAFEQFAAKDQSKDGEEEKRAADPA